MSKITKLVIAVGIVWAVFVAYSYVNAYRSAGPFETYLEGDCPQITIRVIPNELNQATFSRKEHVELIAWFDKKTGKEIFTTDESYRRYLSTQNCTKQKFFALIRKEAAKQGSIQPELRIKYGYMLVIMFTPLVALLLIGALPAEVLRRRRRQSPASS